jgi:hypothetical protein
MADTKTLFTRTSKEARALKGQAAIVLEALEAANQPMTIESLAKVIGAEALRTRQDPERVVAYYLCIFKKEGVVTATRPVTVAVAKNEVEDTDPEDEDTDDEDDNADETEDEADEVEDEELETVE